LATKSNLGLAAAGFGAAMMSHSADHQFSSARWANNGVNGVLKPGEHAGALAVHVAGGLATYALGRATGDGRIAHLGAKLFRAQIVAQSTTQAIKLAADRTRPDGTTLSFPSGHTSSMFATASVLHGEYGWKVGIPAYAMASWVGASRIEKKRHYLSDVLAGATIGILAGRSVTFGSGHTRFAIVPLAAPGGVGVSLVKIGQ
jgi:membrane-associated phospholipid phosphatase